MQIELTEIGQIFDSFAKWYGGKWTRRFDPIKYKDEKDREEQTLNKIEREKTVWRNALQGCTKDEARKVLRICKEHAAASKFSMPPNQIKFFNVAKGLDSIIVMKEGNVQKYQNVETKKDQSVKSVNGQRIDKLFGNKFKKQAW